MPRESVSFDRAAAYYDRTRAMPADASQAITDAILGQLESAGADRLLEIGIGTGRIARPLLARGLPVTGVDISAEMMHRLREQIAAGSREPGLIFGDATRLPFAGGAFPSVLVVHVLHLVSSAEAALAEIRRVLAPGGVFLHKVQRDDEPLAASTAWWDDALDRRRHPPIRRLRFEDQREMIRATGATLDLIRVCQVTDRTSADAIMETTRKRIHSWTWQVADNVFAACIDEHEAWFRSHYPAEIVEHITHELEVWRWPET